MTRLTAYKVRLSRRTNTSSMPTERLSPLCMFLSIRLLATAADILVTARPAKVHVYGLQGDNTARPPVKGDTLDVL